MKLKILPALICALALSASLTLAQAGAGGSKLNTALQQELLSLGKEDQKHRGRLMELVKQESATGTQSEESRLLWEK